MDSYAHGMPDAWQAYFHCMCNTYGTWLRGDRRGWRERHHRRHVDGDYKHPPQKGTYEQILKHSLELMKREPVHLEMALRAVALKSIVECLSGDGILVLIACLDDHHLHVLGRFKDLQPRRWLGWAKYFGTKAVKQFLSEQTGNECRPLNLREGEGIWGKGSECIPIKNCAHRLRCLNYVADHWKRGALVWLNPSLPPHVPSI